MKVETFIKKYCERNKEPDFDMCPAIVFYWDRVNGRCFYNTKTGELLEGQSIHQRLYELKGKDDWVADYLSCRSYPVDGVYIKRIRDDIIEVSTIKLDKTNRGKYGEKRKWKYGYNYLSSGGRVFIDRKTLNPYDSNGNRLWESADGRYYNKTLITYLHILGHQGIYCARNSIKEFANWAGVDKVVGYHGNLQELNYIWQLPNCIKKLKERPVSKVCYTFLNIELSERDYDSNESIEFQIINDSWSVFRLFKKGDRKWDCINRTYKYYGTSIEIARVYISNDGNVKTAFYSQSSKKYEITSQPIKNLFYVWRKEDVLSIGFEDIYNWKCISWIKEMICDIDNPYDIVISIIDILRHPIVEKLYKTGYKKLAKELMRNNTIAANAKSFFYLDKLNEKNNPYNVLKVNKYLLKIVEDNMSNNDMSRWCRYNPSSVIRAMRQFNSMGDLSSLSKDTINEQFNIFNALTEGSSRKLEYFIDPNCHSRWHYGNNDAYSCTNELNEDVNKIFNKVIHIYNTDKEIIDIYKDTVNMYRNLINKPELNWDFKNSEELLQIHNNLVELKNIEDRDRRAAWDKQRAEELEKQKKMFEKLQEKRIEDYECVGDDYEIRVPHDLVEITTEGTYLHHCVGGYLNKHANGNTNIIFLRKKSQPSIPFYTIEVLPTGYITQIHGKYNRWLGNDPEAISFVWKWINDRDLKCEKYKLLDTASGYSQSGNMVSESYLTA